MRTLLFSCFALLMLRNVHAQSPGYSYESLKLNASPAYVMLGVEPVNINRPGSPSDFIAGVQSAVVNNQLQPNFALETTPYYWKNPSAAERKLIRADDYILSNGDDVWGNIKRSFTFSAATSTSDTFTFGQMKRGTGYGIGVHFILFSGRTNTRIRETLETKFGFFARLSAYEFLLLKLDLDLGANNKGINVNEELNNWKESIKGSVEDMNSRSNYSYPIDVAVIIKEVRSKIDKKVLTGSEDKKILQNEIDGLKIESRKLLDELNTVKVPLTKEGFMLEAAIGNSGVVESNDWNMISNAKTAIWLTPSFRINTRQKLQNISYLDIMGVVRYMWNRAEVDSGNYVDLGARLQYTHNRISISSEYVARWSSHRPENVNKNYTWRFDFSFDYKISDLVTFNATFGSNFDGNSIHYSDPKKLFALGGLNFGLGNLFR